MARAEADAGLRRDAAHDLLGDGTHAHAVVVGADVEAIELVAGMRADEEHRVDHLLDVQVALLLVAVAQHLELARCGAQPAHKIENHAVRRRHADHVRKAEHERTLEVGAALGFVGVFGLVLRKRVSLSYNERITR